MATDPNSVKLVLFDLDGTLADTFKDLYWALNQALAEQGYAAADAIQTRALVSLGMRTMTQAALAAQAVASDTIIDQIHQRSLLIYAENVAQFTTLFAGIEEILDALDDANIDYGVVSNKIARFTEPLLEHLQLSQRLCCIISGDTAAHAKPHPAPLLLAAQRSNVSVEHCIYVGDAHNDVIASHAANMRVVVAGYGYLAINDKPQTWQATAVVDHPRQLLEHLRPAH